MRRRASKSEIIVYIIFSMMVSSVIAYAFFVKNNTVPLSLECRPSLELGKGEFLTDACFLDYSHLHCEFQDVQLDSDVAFLVEMEGYANAWDQFSLQTRNDTLYIKKIRACSPNFVTDESINAIKVKVGSKSLKSITVGKNGSIVHPLKPYGAYDDGKPAYKERELKNHTFRFDTIKINLIANGYVNLIMKGIQLEMNIKDGKIQSRGPEFYGDVEQFVVNKFAGKKIINAKYLNVKSAIVNPNKIKDQSCGGSINLNVSESLVSNLYSELDVNYIGNPSISKEETGYGRLIKISTNTQ